MQGIRRDPPRLGFREKLAAERRVRLILEINVPARLRDQGRGMRAMGGAVKPPARCCSKSHRICQIRPSTKPIAIATEIWKTITSNKVIGIFPSGQCH
jgi:hypothetical protein